PPLWREGHCRRDCDIRRHAARLRSRRWTKRRDRTLEWPGMNGNGKTKRFARAGDLGLSRGEFAILERLCNPLKVQAFLNAIPINHEIGGETVLSVREVLRQRRAHCIEGAMLAACAQWVPGEAPLVMHLHRDVSDFPRAI